MANLEERPQQRFFISDGYANLLFNLIMCSKIQATHVCQLRENISTQKEDPSQRCNSLRDSESCEFQRLMTSRLRPIYEFIWQSPFTALPALSRPHIISHHSSTAVSSKGLTTLPGLTVGNVFYLFNSVGVVNISSFHMEELGASRGQQLSRISCAR